MHSNEEKLKKMISEFMKFAKEIYIDAKSEKEILTLIFKLRYEHVILFHLGEIKYVFYKNQKKAKLIPKYTCSLTNYNNCINSILIKLNELNKKIILFDNEYEKEKFIHDFLCKEVVYEDIGEDSHTIIGPLLKGKGVCDGISKTAKLLFQISKINSHIIIGKSRNIDKDKWEAHAWNIVFINDDWYNLDITFDNTISNKYIRYDYFNITDARIQNDHILENDSNQTKYICNKDLDYYELNNIAFVNIELLQKYIKFCLKKYTENIQIRILIALGKEDLEKIFIDEVKKFKTSVSFSMKYNKFSGVCSWTISYYS